MEKYQCFATNIFWSQKCDFFGDFGQKTRTAGLIMLKLSTKVNQVFWGKNLENENFMAAAIHCENWYFKKTNIFHYFPSKNLKYSQIFLSETIHAQENGSRGPHFAKSLNSNFLKGLTYSAMRGLLLPQEFHKSLSRRRKLWKVKTSKAPTRTFRA